MRDILEQHDYQRYYEDNRSFLEVWWERLANWIGEQLAGVFSGFESSSGFADLVLILIIAAVLILSGIVVSQRIRHSRVNRGLAELQTLRSSHQNQWTYANHLQAARQQEDFGKCNEAARHIFLALLLYFHENEWLKIKTWKTNGEYLAELKHINKQLADSFYKLALVFDEMVYGERELKQDDYVHFRDEAMKWLNGGPQEFDKR
ncbi:DUF4129 domain-containing protein [Lentibacillus kapialis]|uniref:DUF4129 domain-containing protein n=1 Tax=Lentibacillus kapialis TaxID=340214 RepID=UPI001669B3E1|nr:DUF4129 domain-containing protein [Lentibacillus kapialis]